MVKYPWLSVATSRIGFFAPGESWARTTWIKVGGGGRSKLSRTRPARRPPTTGGEARSAVGDAPRSAAGHAGAGWGGGSFGVFLPNVPHPPRNRQQAKNQIQATARTAWPSGSGFVGATVPVPRRVSTGFPAEDRQSRCSAPARLSILGGPDRHPQLINRGTALCDKRIFPRIDRRSRETGRVIDGVSGPGDGVVSIDETR